MNILFALAIAMAVGMAMTRLIRLIHLPNVTAYLIAGLLVGPYVLKVLTPEMNSKLSIISDVALGFIAYSIGSEFKFSYIKEIGAKPMVITAFEGCVASLLVFLTLLVLGQPLPMCLALGDSGEIMQGLALVNAGGDADGRPPVQGERPGDADAAARCRYGRCAGADALRHHDDNRPHA